MPIFTLFSEVGISGFVTLRFRYHSLDGTAPQYELDFMSDRDDVLNPEMAKLDAGALLLLLLLK